MRDTTRATRAEDGLSAAVNMLSVYRQLGRARDKAFSLAIRSSFRSFGSHTVIQPPVHVRGEQRISIGNDVFIADHAWLVALESPAGEVSSIHIGHGTKIGSSCFITAASKVTLGTCVLLGRNVHIADHQHAYADITRPIPAQGIDKVMSVEVGDGAWLGNNTVVTPGTRIGTGSVIGANSVVTDDVPDYSVAVGAPARVVKTFS